MRRWCDWVDRVLDDRPALPEVLVHGDLHGYNQVWDPATASLLAVVDFEESGVADRHFDLRYLPSNAHGLNWCWPSSPRTSGSSGNVSQSNESWRGMC